MAHLLTSNCLVSYPITVQVVTCVANPVNLDSLTFQIPTHIISSHLHHLEEQNQKPLFELDPGVLGFRQCKLSRLPSSRLRKGGKKHAGLPSTPSPIRLVDLPPSFAGLVVCTCSAAREVHPLNVVHCIPQRPHSLHLTPDFHRFGSLSLSLSLSLADPRPSHYCSKTRNTQRRTLTALDLKLWWWELVAALALPLCHWTIRR
ncbi:hypothetical protein LZ30DRAFT_173745 [Colletotrichum cereale]|nr:hypothetical protein LZ30DRAFT_173745 [Colletotrichum cereale]